MKKFVVYVDGFAICEDVFSPQDVKALEKENGVTLIEVKSK